MIIMVNTLINYFLQTSDTQFGFKKGLGCNHAIVFVPSLNLSFARAVL